jgi:hypothetical protein
MVVLVLSIVKMALPSVEEDLGFSEKCLQWMVSGYALTFGGLLTIAFIEFSCFSTLLPERAHPI